MKTSQADTMQASERPSRLTLIAGVALALFLLVYAVNARYNYSIKMSGDEYQYLKSAKALLRGSFTVDSPAYSMLKKQFPDMAGRGRFSCFAVSPSGKLVSYYSAGISLFFAPLCALLGANVFWVAPLLLDIAAMLCLFLFALFYFRERGDRYGPALALLCVAVYGAVIDFHLGIRRDAVGASIVMAISLLVLFASRNKKWALWHCAFALLTFLFTIKVSYAFLYIPFSLLFVVSMKGQWKSAKFVALQILFAACLSAVILTPFFLQNSVGTGHWYLLTQSSEASDFLIPADKNGRFAWLFTNIRHMIRAQSHVYSVKGTPVWTALFFAACAGLGLWQERKNSFVRLWVVPMLVLIFSLYATTDRQDNIYNLYLSPACYMTVFLCVCGIRLLADRFSRRNAVIALAVALTLIPFLALKTFRIIPSHRHAYFQAPQAQRLAADITAIVPPTGILLCDKYLSTIVDYFTDVQCFPAADLKSGASDETAKIDFMLSHGVNVYFCDYEGYDFEPYYWSRFRQRFALKPAASGLSLYGFSGPAKNVSYAIYKIYAKQ